MTFSDSEITYLQDQLDSLRTRNITAYAKQRLGVADQRLSNPDALPNILVTRVAAIEGFIRSLVMHLHAKNKKEMKEIYPKFRYRKIVTLIEEYLKAKSLGKPKDVFGEDYWKIFKLAVQYRNLLVHESTYLGQM